MANVTRRTRRGAAAALAAGTVLATTAVAVPAEARDRTPYTYNCPKAERLVSGHHWVKRTVAPGVTLAETGEIQDQNGTVKLHVLTVKLTTRKLHVRPLVRSLAERVALSHLAKGHPHLVAATNTGYFDFRYGTPTGDFVSAGFPYVATSSAQTVVGITSTGRAAAGAMALSGTASTSSGKHAVAGVNWLNPHHGLVVYTPRWGSQRIPLPRSAEGRYVTDGRVSSAVARDTQAPARGDLLVALDSSSREWLESLAKGQKLRLSLAVASTTAQPLRQAYGVGQQVVVNGTAKTHMNCRRDYPQPARTAIGFRDHGRVLILMLAEDVPGRPLHGLDNNQVARVMADLGARQAYEFDGSGSTELLARVHGRGTVDQCQRDVPSGLHMSCRTYPADGAEREMPLGLGIFYS